MNYINKLLQGKDGGIPYNGSKGISSKDSVIPPSGRNDDRPNVGIRVFEDGKAVLKYPPPSKATCHSERSEEPVTDHNHSTLSEEPLTKNRHSERSEEPITDHNHSTLSEETLTKTRHSERSEEPITDHNHSTLSEETKK